jgi:membrane-associated protein
MHAGPASRWGTSFTDAGEDDRLNTFLIDALQHYGYPALWLIVFVAAAGAPVSGSLLLSAAGAFAALGDLSLFILFPLALSAAVMGDNVTYFVGRRVGLPLLSWLERQKRFRWISPQAVERGRAYFRRRAWWSIFITRFLIVILGGPINLLAGLEQYPYPNFLLWDISGQVLGAVISLSMGYIFAESWEEMAGLFGAFSGLVLATLASGILTIVLVRRVRQHRQAGAASVTTVIDVTNVTAAAGTADSELLDIPPLVDALVPLESKVARITTPLPIPE